MSEHFYCQKSLKESKNIRLTTPSIVSTSVDCLRNFDSVFAKSSMDFGSIPGISLKSERISAMSASVRYSLDSLVAASPAGAPKHA